MSSGGSRLTSSLRRASAVNGGGLATFDIPSGRKQTWTEFEAHVARLAGGLQAHGVKDGARVAILALNSDRYLEAYYAAPWAGAIIVPLNCRLAPAELAGLLNNCEATALIVDDVFAKAGPALKEAVPSIKHVIFSGNSDAPEGAVSWDTLGGDAQVPVADADRHGVDTAGLFYTGGTTGLPKGVELTHDNLTFNAMGIVAELRYDAASRYLHVGPMFHLADGASTFAVTMVAGTHLFVPRFEPESCLKAFSQGKATHALLVPTMLGMLVQFPDFDKFDLSTVQFILYGGSPMPEAVQNALFAKLPKTCGLVQGYGMTETSPVITYLPASEHFPGSKTLRSAGRATLGIDIRIVEADGTPVGQGAVGEITTKGPHVMKGYFKNEEATKAAIKDGWMWTGDVGFIDERGFVFIVDRSKDMIVSGGENVYCTETENAVYTFPGVSQCAVIGVPDEKFGEAVCAIVVPKADTELSEDAIKEHCKTLIANYKCPRKVVIRTEPLPLSGAGKVAKVELRKPFWEGKERKVN